MRLAHAMIGAFSYMRYSYHGDFMIPKIEVGTDQDFLLIVKNNLQEPSATQQSLTAGKYMIFGAGAIADQFFFYRN